MWVCACVDGFEREKKREICDDSILVWIEFVAIAFTLGAGVAVGRSDAWRIGLCAMDACRLDGCSTVSGQADCAVGGGDCGTTGIAHADKTAK